MKCRVCGLMQEFIMKKKNLSDLTESMRSCADSVKEALEDPELDSEEKRLLVEQAREIHELEADYEPLDDLEKKIGYHLAIASLSPGYWGSPDKDDKQTELIALTEGQGTKRCTQCNLKKPLTEYHIVIDRRRSPHKVKPHSWCKECVNKKNVERAKRRRIKRHEENGTQYRPFNKNRKKPTEIEKQWFCGNCNREHEVAFVHIPRNDKRTIVTPELANFIDELGVLVGMVGPGSRPQDQYPCVGVGKKIYSKIKKILPGFLPLTKNRPQRLLQLHRLIMRPPEGLLVDHIDRNKFNNLPCNLRLVTPLQNMWNQGSQVNSSSRFRGVVKVSYASGEKFHAKVKLQGQRYKLGRYDNELHAAWMVDMFSMMEHGEYGYRNFKEHELLYGQLIEEGLDPRREADQKVIIEKLESLTSL